MIFNSDLIYLHFHQVKVTRFHITFHFIIFSLFNIHSNNLILFQLPQLRKLKH